MSESHGAVRCKLITPAAVSASTRGQTVWPWLPAVSLLSRVLPRVCLIAAPPVSCPAAGLAFGSDGHLYIADKSGHCIRKLDQATGIVSLVVNPSRQAGASIRTECTPRKSTRPRISNCMVRSCNVTFRLQ